MEDSQNDKKTDAESNPMGDEVEVKVEKESTEPTAPDLKPTVESDQTQSKTDTESESETETNSESEESATTDSGTDSDTDTVDEDKDDQTDKDSESNQDDESGSDDSISDESAEEVVSSDTEALETPVRKVGADSSTEKPEMKAAPTPTGAAATPQLVFGKGSQVLRNLVIVALSLLLIAAGAFVVLQLTKEEPVSNQQEVVKNEIPLLRISAQEGPLNLFYTEVSNDGANMINNHMYEGLVTYENINKIVPLLATSWTNPNDETWIFELKENVKFHNGEVMTAEDVKATLDNAANVGQGSSGIALKSVKVVDANTVEVVTDGPDPLLLGRLVGIWIKDASAEVKAGEAPVGTGPYTVKVDSKPGANELTLAAFNDYHDGTVYTKEVNVKVMSTTDAVKAFNEGKIDIASTLVSDSEDLNLANQQLVTIKDFTVAFLSMNGSKAGSPLAKLPVRQAIAQAINPEPIITAQKVIGEPINQFVTPDIPGFNTEIERFEQNVTEAKKLLSDAGYADGFSLTLSYASDSNDGQFNTIKSQLAAIGITVVKDGYGDDHDGFFAKLFSGSADLLFLAYSPEVLDASDTFTTMFGAESALSYSNADVVELLDKASKTLNESERLGILKQIGQELHDDVAAVPLYSRDSITAMNKSYAAVRHMPNGGSGFKFNQVYLP